MITGGLGMVAALLVALYACFVAIERRAARDRQLLRLSLVAHIVAAVAQVIITRRVFGGGDMLFYFEQGRLLALGMLRDFGLVAPGVVGLFLQRDVNIPVAYEHIGTSTGTMQALSAFAQYALGSNLYGMCLLLSLAGFLARLQLYRVTQLRLPDSLHRIALVSCMLVPSVVFWTAGFLKESFAVIGMAVAIHAGHAIVAQRRTVGPLLALVPALGLVALTKAYILLPLAIAGSAWYYVHRSSGGTGRIRRLRPVQLTLALMLAVLFVFGVGELFPRYRVDAFATQAIALQEVGQQFRGGSTFALSEGISDTPAGIYALGPVALLTSLFRPQLFDVSSPVVAVAALEMTALTGLIIVGLRRRGLRGGLRLMLRSHTLLFCAIFVVGFGTGVGLTTTNFGTLARYRVPMLPMYVLFVLVWSGVGRVRVRRGAQAAPAALPITRREAERRAAASVSPPTTT